MKKRTQYMIIGGMVLSAGIIGIYLQSYLPLWLGIGFVDTMGGTFMIITEYIELLPWPEEMPL